MAKLFTAAKQNAAVREKRMRKLELQKEERRAERGQMSGTNNGHICKPDAADDEWLYVWGSIPARIKLPTT